MKILITGASDITGGAARASWRLHRALVRAQIDSQMLVIRKLSDDWRVVCPSTKLAKMLALARPTLGAAIMRMQETESAVIHSPAVCPSGLGRLIEASNADVVSLQWLGNEAMSVEELGRVRKPLVWTLHDMWPFCGAEHYVDDGAAARFRSGYTKDSRLRGQRGIDINRWVWRRKRRAWTRSMTLVCPSRWLAECARASVLMGDWPSYVIPNLLDTDLYRPHDKSWCRRVLGLPMDVPLILFGAIGGSRDPRKGFDLLADALRHLLDEQKMRGARCVVFGQTEPEHEADLAYPVHWMGHLYDDVSLVLLYNAVDVVVVPSLAEAFGQTAAEAQACGTPVVVFDATGLSDVVEHRVTGYSARPYSAEDLAKGVVWVLDDADRYQQLAEAARRRSIELWAPEVVVPQYVHLYRQVMTQARES